jgi:hypothetical protein
MRCYSHLSDDERESGFRTRTRGAQREPVTESSDRQENFRWTFQENRIGLRERARRRCGYLNMDKGNLTANKASECAVQVLQFVVLNEAIGVAGVMIRTHKRLGRLAEIAGNLQLHPSRWQTHRD